MRAQSQKWEAFGGYQFTRFELPFPAKVNGNGWGASLAYNINPWLAAKVDFSGSYNSGTNLLGYNIGLTSLLTYTLGPVVSVHPARNTRLFAEVLAGGYRDSNIQFTGSPEQGWTLMAGGGLDEGIGKRFAFRICDVDWFRFMSGTGTYNYGSKTNFRFSTGVVIHF